MGTRNTFVALGLAVSLTACGGRGGGNPTSPTTPKRASITGTMTVKGERPADGVRYTADIRLTERGGVPATITTVDFTFYAGNSPFASSEFSGAEAWVGGNRILANGTLVLKVLGTYGFGDADPIATRVEAGIPYTDDNQNGGNLTLAADVPALPAGSVASAKQRADAVGHRARDTRQCASGRRADRHPRRAERRSADAHGRERALQHRGAHPERVQGEGDEARLSRCRCERKSDRERHAGLPAGADLGWRWWRGRWWWRWQHAVVRQRHSAVNRGLPQQSGTEGPYGAVQRRHVFMLAEPLVEQTAGGKIVRLDYDWQRPDKYLRTLACATSRTGGCSIPRSSERGLVSPTRDTPSNSPTRWDLPIGRNAAISQIWQDQ